MTDHNDNPPAELAEQRHLQTRATAERDLAQAAAKLRLALSELEYAVLELDLATAAERFVSRASDGPGTTAALPDLRRVAAAAIVGRLRLPLAPYLDAAAGELLGEDDAALDEELLAHIAGHVAAGGNRDEIE